MAAPIQLGTALVITLTFEDADGEAEDISAATASKVRLQDPEGVSTDHAAGFVTDGSDGQITVTLAASVLAKAGDWKLQGFATIGGSDKPTGIGSFEVAANLPAPSA